MIHGLPFVAPHGFDLRRFLSTLLALEIGVALPQAFRF